MLAVVVLCAGCSDSDQSTKLNALSAKLDSVILNQAAIFAKLDGLPNTKYNYLYYSNIIYQVFETKTNLLAALTSQEFQIENSVNSETRRVGVIIFTNVAGFQVDTLSNLSDIRFHLKWTCLANWTLSDGFAIANLSLSDGFAISSPTCC